ncbi:hypothetical protein [Cytobacillus oceanisediminis]|uniref:hypothetical protein n=1 Tax=Cytobacillus oceanisediminis TaxID=665099 RepID=UPI002079329E|nr:hypothetical protein [Cytobacillus oceanisediminis]USK45515.1 hypothetical protein LIT27_06610 [Cytobacillus oceanisediminis]
MANQDRLNFIKAYFAVEDEIRLEIPVTSSDTITGTVIKRFTGKRAGIEFKDGIGYCKRKDVSRIKDAFPYIIAHLPEEAKGSAE